MDITPTLKESVGKFIDSISINQKNPRLQQIQLQRSRDDINDQQNRLIVSSHSADEEAKSNVMGGGFATSPYASGSRLTSYNDLNNENLQMHEKLLDNEEGCEKVKSSREKSEKSKTKFAEKLRRSFRRTEHKSFEVKRQYRSDPIDGKTEGKTQEAKILKSVQQQSQPKNSPSIFSLTNLPGLGGHINPALLLDSPDESTPPEFGYRHLSSVATTNSSTSLESNFCESPTTATSVSYWSWHLNNSNNNNMGAEVSTTSTQQTREKPATSSESKRHLEQQSSSKSDTHSESAPPLNEASRSCSSTSESSTAAKLTRLQNFLFKSSNESSRSIQGHSNEGFTASSRNSSSGEWENLCGLPSTTVCNELSNDKLHVSMSQKTDDSPAGSYYQYTLASPSNPFLPEITARTYHSTYDETEELKELDEEELDANVTSVKYHVGSYSAQMPTPNYSRAGSQESTHSDCAPCTIFEKQLNSCSSTPGTHKRKLFSLSTPTKLNSSHQMAQQQQQQQQQQSSSTASAKPSTSATDTYASISSKSSTTQTSLSVVRSLNPFIPTTTVTSSSPPPPSRTTSSSSLNRRIKPLKQMAITSPTATVAPKLPKDLNAKREEFLRATMQICLVVSPPSTRLQLKSKSLTHLDGLGTETVCNHAKNNANIRNAVITTTLNTNYTLSASLSPPLPQYHMKRSLSPVRFSSQHHHHISHHHYQRRTYSSQKVANRLSPIIYTQAPQQPSSKSLVSNLSLYSTYKTTSSCTTTTTAACYNSRICSSHTSSSNKSSCSNLHLSSHQHYHANKFQSDASSLATISSAKQPSNTLKSLPIADNSNNIAKLCNASGDECGGNVGGSAVALPISSSAASLYPPGSSVTPINYKQKSFMQRKKPMLTRSEVSSSEYFSVSFCMESGFQEEEFFPATKGVTLANALNQAIKRRNLSFSQLNITDINDDNSTQHLLDAKYKPLQRSLDENTEVEQLAGHHLMITDKEGSRKTLQKAASFGSRSRPPRLLSSASTDESSDVNLSGKQLKQRWSGLFGVKNPQQSQLCELLNNYSKTGVPQKTIPTYDFEHPDLEAAVAYLDNIHKSWRDIVQSDRMSDSEMRIQTAIWELVTTEVDYIHCLQTVTDLFLACLEAVQDEGLLQDVDQYRLFANIREICEANLKFWTFYLYPMVSHSIAMNEPLRVGFFQSGFIQFANIFSPYKKYCAEQSSCQFYCKELNRNNSVFTSYLAWCEAQKMCNRLRLADILVRPMQRLTKYSLLLAAIRKHMSEVEEIEAIDAMVQNTENFVFSVNNHLTTRQENERLKGVMARIESYDVVDTNNEHLDKLIKQYSQMFDLCGPMKGCAPQHVRHLFMEGDHKYKDNHGKADVHCFLLTDMLLVCKSIAKKGLGSLKVIRQPYLTDRLVVQHTNNILSCVYLNEFQVAITAFTLQCTEAKSWYESLKRAKMVYARLKQCSTSNWESNLRYTGSIISAAGTIDSLGVKKSPLNSSICSHVTSANNSHSGSVEWNDSRNVSVDFEKTNSLSSDEGCSYLGAHGFPVKAKPVTTISPQKLKINTVSIANTLAVQPLHHLGQSLPNLTLHHSQANNTLLVPGTTSSHSGNVLLSPSHRGISYPPPNPSRVPLRRGMAFSSSIKNPPLLKTRNITSQNSINWHQIPATPTPTSPTTHQLSQQPANQNSFPKTIEAENINITSPSILSNSLAYNFNNPSDTTQSEINNASRINNLPPLNSNQTFATQLSNTETDV